MVEGEPDDVALLEGGAQGAQLSGSLKWWTVMMMMMVVMKMMMMVLLDKEW